MIKDLAIADQEFRRVPDNPDAKSPYHKKADSFFEFASQYLAWSCYFPDGIDMEALSPRDPNAHVRVKKESTKSKAPAKFTGKEKDHPPPPPPEVYEPPSSDRKDGATYNTGRCLGKGGFAICHEGQLAGTKQKYALKIVKSHMPQKKMEQKFQTELQIHSKMRHANIVQFHRAFSFNQCTFIVLELCPNGSLMDMVKKRKYVTEPEVRYWTVQMAGAIKYMHSKGIIHRDLKMGNIFLDKDMNVKVGDFGLAALLVTGKDWQAHRRTTLCGTPNYIAPEILAKDKGGHDHAVDIWSLGIIIFALLTGKPPFQAATQEEIYRRARELEYDWPKLDTSENYISDETKDLVAELLQAPDKRPDPDTIVQHPFFICGWMPQDEEMTPSLRERHPDPTQFLSVGARNGRANLYTRNLKKLCIKCEVGPWNPASKQHTSTYREVAQEEKAGLTPIVPLAEDVVYRPFSEWLQEQSQREVEMAERFRKSEDTLEKQLSPEPKKMKTEASTSRPPTQSFAAQQRARPLASASSVPTRLVKTRQPSQESGSRGQGILNLASRSKTRRVETKLSEDTAAVQDRLAADLVNQLNTVEAERKAQAEEPQPSSQIQESIFNPQEQLESVSNTTPDHILDGLRRLQTELERVLNTRTTALETKKSPPVFPIVVKWVDYTNKYGLGYVLSNGSIGSIFKALPANFLDPKKGYVPPTCLVIRDAERHLQNKRNEAYPDRHEIVPVSGPNIEFYENRSDKGLVRGKVNPMNYKAIHGPNGESPKLLGGKDEYDDRKRELLVLWKKFSNYMYSFGKDADFAFDEALTRTPSRQEDSAAAGNVVTFYQRWGDVGCWAFCDGHFQFNFPDHTKIIISSDGTWCNFYHLPLEAARELATRGEIPPNGLDDRSMLSYPLQTLLNFMAKPSKSTMRKRPEISPMIQGIPHANDFRRKIEFVRDIVKEWVLNGGMGCSNMTAEKRLKFKGFRETENVKIPMKHVWTTVGARNGDERRVAWFNPKKPDEIIQDIKS